MITAVRLLIFLPFAAYAVHYVLFRSELRDALPLLVDGVRSGDRDRIRLEARFFLDSLSTCPICRLWWVLLGVELFTTVAGGSFDLARLAGTYGMFIATGDLADQVFTNDTAADDGEGNPWPS